MAERKKAPTRAKKATTQKGREAQAKTAAAADGKAKHTGLITKLAPIAKEINHKLTQAAKTDAKADDYRLSASIRLAEAKAMCEKEKLPFKKWAEENVEQKFETVRKMVAIGAAKDPAQALAETRTKNKTANKKHRDTKKAVEDKSTPPATVRARSPFERVENALEEMDDKMQLNTVQSAASRLGMQVVSKQRAQEITKAEKAEKAAPATLDLAALKQAFTDLKASDQMDFVSFAADAVGATVEMPFSDGEVDLTPPEFLKGKGKSKKAS